MGPQDFSNLAGLIVLRIHPLDRPRKRNRLADVFDACQ